MLFIYSRTTQSQCSQEDDCRSALQDRPPGEDEQTWELSRFTPMLQEVIEELVAGSLSSDEYPHVRPPHAASNGRYIPFTKALILCVW